MKIASVFLSKSELGFVVVNFSSIIGFNKHLHPSRFFFFDPKSLTLMSHDPGISIRFVTNRY